MDMFFTAVLTFCFKKEDTVFFNGFRKAEKAGVPVPKNLKDEEK